MENHFVMTISHEVGCGGAYIGKKIADIFSVPFVDREILKTVADQLSISEEDVENRDERIESFWASFARLESNAYGDYSPSGKELFELETKFIEQIAQKESVVILGRGGRYILRNHPDLFSIFVYANPEDRIHRIAEQKRISLEASKKYMMENDRERISYMKTFIRQDWLDVRNYDLSVNTSALGLDKTAEIVAEYIKDKLS